MLLAHRFRELVAEPRVAGMPAMSAGFTPCPGPLLATFGPVQMARVADIYQLARAMTEAQMRPPVRFRAPAFSRN